MNLLTAVLSAAFEVKMQEFYQSCIRASTDVTEAYCEMKALFSSREEAETVQSLWKELVTPDTLLTEVEEGFEVLARWQ